ncbi:tail fiber domain-containing protein, partial [bacterium]|nr:tail fiber domain-containing protein [bacterium]
MNGVYYDWIDGNNKPSVGVIAQEIEKVLPEVVNDNANGLKSVSYGNFTG